MTTRRRILLWTMLLLPVVAYFGYSAFGYGKYCTVCLRGFHVEERKMLGLTFWTSETLRFEGHDMTPLVGAPCRHVFRTRGCEWITLQSIGCGDTAEGRWFEGRWDALKELFRLEKAPGNKEMFQESVAKLDSLIPPDSKPAFSWPEQCRIPVVAAFAGKLKLAKSTEEWRRALEELDLAIKALPGPDEAPVR